MFDVDAIRQEALKLAIEGADIEEIKGHMQIREIESTMPALMVSSPGPSEANGTAPIRQTRSFDESMATRKSAELSMPNGHAISPRPSYEGNGYGADPTGSEAKTSTSFETPNRPPSISPPSSTYHSSRPSPIPSPDPSSKPDRPPLRTATTAPEIPAHSHSRVTSLDNPSVGEIKSPDHNPWNDDEEAFGKERQVEMSFE